jgi:dipeptidyl aminopeptidase/acylaminoacyl peptidase
MMKNDRSDGGPSNETYVYELKEIGDPDRDKDKLAQASPITYADTYRPPVLLVHGTDDTIVSSEQSKIMERALKGAKHDVRLIMVQDEDHRDWTDDDEKKTLGEVADFIKAHIAPAPLSPPSPSPAN